MKYQLKKETKPTLSTFGKYKAVTRHQQTVETEQLIEEVCANEPYSKGTVEAVAWKLAKVINRHLREGDKVRLKARGLQAQQAYQGCPSPLPPRECQGQPRALQKDQVRERGVIS